MHLITWQGVNHPQQCLLASAHVDHGSWFNFFQALHTNLEQCAVNSLFQMFFFITFLPSQRIPSDSWLQWALITLGGHSQDSSRWLYWEQDICKLSLSLSLDYENIDFGKQEIFVPEHPKQVAQETRKTELWQGRQRKGQAVCKCTAQEESCKKM